MEAGMRPEEKKASLLCGGTVQIPPDFHLPFKASRSTAGPGAGSTSVVFAFDGLRVKKSISREEGEFQLVEKEDGLALLHQGKSFIDRVELIPTIYHSPAQAFINLHQNCIYNCRFCTSPRLAKHQGKDLDLEKVRRMIRQVRDHPDLEAVAFTSAVVGSPEETVEEMIAAVRLVREELGPNIPIGVEPYLSSLQQIDRLKQAGADEIKINLETLDPAIFTKVCGELDLDWIKEALAHAVKVFGRGKVTTNLIIGMGEKDHQVKAWVEELAGMGVVPTIRPLRLNAINQATMEEALGTIPPLRPERLLILAKMTKEILQRHGLSPLTYKTMCHRCQCCDIVPFIDL